MVWPLPSEYFENLPILSQSFSECFNLTELSIVFLQRVSVLNRSGKNWQTRWSTIHRCQSQESTALNIVQFAKNSKWKAIRRCSGSSMERRWKSIADRVPCKISKHSSKPRLWLRRRRKTQTSMMPKLRRLPFFSWLVIVSRTVSKKELPLWSNYPQFWLFYFTFFFANNA